MIEKQKTKEMTYKKYVYNAHKKFTFVNYKKIKKIKNNMCIIYI